ncbi:hypothetical protein [Saccharothrix coeruleofusca]|uniref:Uncharacterized protein n=1 Tax=Saccharothrix coeruleofusca TaxID=33919 RepID=A0A918AKS3_9PSEU|nr:hypothetical protein [Saccharothrix coeruleofusca]MBP2336325.1 hypothetical protein [Saccharothrix coeruleofusca]GGP53877.1 hypothetical protein GCM10010185_27750 [Saccharothrix coeruleofusca]
MTTTCPSCGWPADDPAYPVSTHGRVRYVRCVCGIWLVLRDGRLLATAGRPARLR